jgi:hypothetical protein
MLRFMKNGSVSNHHKNRNEYIHSLETLYTCSVTGDELVTLFTHFEEIYASPCEHRVMHSNKKTRRLIE